VIEILAIKFYSR